MVCTNISPLVVKNGWFALNIRPLVGKMVCTTEAYDETQLKSI